jgi:hypothetical protein
MSNLLFPANPAAGDIVTLTNGVSYTWTGIYWSGSTYAESTIATKDYVDSKAAIGVAAWGRFKADSGAPQLVASYNIASVVRGGGDNNWDITFINPMQTPNYAVVAAVNEAGSGTTAFARIRDITPTKFRLATHHSDGSAANFTSYGFAVYAQTSL